VGSKKLYGVFRQFRFYRNSIEGESKFFMRMNIEKSKTRNKIKGG